MKVFLSFISEKNYAHGVLCISRQGSQEQGKNMEKKKDSQEEIRGWADIEFMKVGECKVKETDQGPRNELGVEGREMVLDLNVGKRYTENRRSKIPHKANWTLFRKKKI